jgi:hypothetical protein
LYKPDLIHLQFSANSLLQTVLCKRDKRGAGNGTAHAAMWCRAGTGAGAASALRRRAAASGRGSSAVGAARATAAAAVSTEGGRHGSGRAARRRGPRWSASLTRTPRYDTARIRHPMWRTERMSQRAQQRA